MPPKIEKFLDRNKKNINTLFLTGDVFNIPSLSRWQNLYTKFEDDFDIFIALGNHDLGSHDQNNLIFFDRDIFNFVASKRQPIEFSFF